MNNSSYVSCFNLTIFNILTSGETTDLWCLPRSLSYYWLHAPIQICLHLINKLWIEPRPWPTLFLLSNNPFHSDVCHNTEKIILYIKNMWEMNRMQTGLWFNLEGQTRDVQKIRNTVTVSPKKKNFTLISCLLSTVTNDKIPNKYIPWYVE